MAIASRRHHRERLKKKRRFHWQRDLRSDTKTLGKAVTTPTPCSCWMCRNARRSEGPSLEERKAAADDDGGYQDPGA